MNKTKVLWIEDQAEDPYAELAGPVFANPQFDLTIALNATEGLRFLLEGEFDVVIVDIRLLPGDDKVWIDYYKKQGKDQASARLGLQILKLLFGGENNLAIVKVNIGKIPEWINANRFGVLTVKTPSEIRSELKELGIEIYIYKTGTTPSSVLLDIIEQVMA